MRDWFKYEFGYVNIEHETIYLTSSGNWTEVNHLSEMTREIAKKNDHKQFSVSFYILAVLAFFGFLIFQKIVSNQLGILLMLTAVGLGYKMYDYFKSDMGGQFKIPMNKINDIIIEGNSIQLHYINGEGIEDIKKLIRVNDKGKAIMSTLKRDLINVE